MSVRQHDVSVSQKTEVLHVILQKKPPVPESVVGCHPSVRQDVVHSPQERQSVLTVHLSVHMVQRIPYYFFVNIFPGYLGEEPQFLPEHGVTVLAQDISDRLYEILLLHLLGQG